MTAPEFDAYEPRLECLGRRTLGLREPDLVTDVCPTGQGAGLDAGET